MSRSAHVTSIEDLLPLRSALVRFAAQATDCLEMIQLHNHRVIDWLEHDRPAYWKDRVRRGWDDVGTARSELERARLRNVGDREPPCREEKAALAAAKRRLRYAEEKVKVVAQWGRKARHEVFEYDARSAQLLRTLESELPRSIAVLDRMIRALQAYAEVAKPGVGVGGKATVAGKEKGREVGREGETAGGEDMQ